MFPLCFFFFWTPFLFVSFAISRWMLKKRICASRPSVQIVALALNDDKDVPWEWLGVLMDTCRCWVVRWQGGRLTGSVSSFFSHLAFYLSVYLEQRHLCHHAQPLPSENCASEDLQWPSSSHGPSGGQDIVAIPQSQLPLLPPKMYVDLCVLCFLPRAPCPRGVRAFSIVYCHLVELQDVAKRSTCLRPRFECNDISGNSPCSWRLWPAQWGREEEPKAFTKKE